jgi:hypothetical protein
MALYVIGWLTITLLLALAGYAIGAKLRDRQQSRFRLHA